VVKPFDGVARELVRAVRGDRLTFETWSADGKHVVFRRNDRSLHAVAIATEEEIDLHIQLNSATNPASVRPNTTQIAFPERVIEWELRIRPLLPHLK